MTRYGSMAAIAVVLVTMRASAANTDATEASGEETAPMKSAPASFVVHADAATNYRLRQWPGFTGGLDVGFEVKNCCGFGFYFSSTSLNSEDVKSVDVNQLLEGGLEFAVIVPRAERLRFRARAGRSGTAPELPDFGRAGFAGSVAILYRFLGGPSPAVGKAFSGVDALIGVSGWALGKKRTAAAPLHEPETPMALIVGLRLGVDYGVEF